MKKMIIAFLTLYASTGFAILSPLNQSLEEIQTILQNTELQKFIPQNQPIMQIQHVMNGYLLITDKMRMLVEIQYVPIERPGRQQLKLIFHEPTSIIK